MFPSSIGSDPSSSQEADCVSVSLCLRTGLSLRMLLLLSLVIKQLGMVQSLKVLQEGQLFVATFLLGVLYGTVDWWKHAAVAHVMHLFVGRYNWEIYLHGAAGLSQHRVKAMFNLLLWIFILNAVYLVASDMIPSTCRADLLSILLEGVISTLTMCRWDDAMAHKLHQGVPKHDVVLLVTHTLAAELIPVDMLHMAFYGAASSSIALGLIIILVALIGGGLPHLSRTCPQLPDTIFTCGRVPTAGMYLEWRIHRGIASILHHLKLTNSFLLGGLFLSWFIDWNVASVLESAMLVALLLSAKRTMSAHLLRYISVALVGMVNGAVGLNDLSLSVVHLLAVQVITRFKSFDNAQQVLIQHCQIVARTVPLIVVLSIVVHTDGTLALSHPVPMLAMCVIHDALAE